MLFVGDDWAEDHHDVEVVDEAGKRLTKKRLPEGVAGLAQLHGLIADHLPDDADPADLAGRDGLAVLTAAPSPEQGRRLTPPRVVALLRRGGRQRYLQTTAEHIVQVLRGEQLAARPAVVGAYAASTAALIAVITSLSTQVSVLAEQVGESFGRHPDAEIYLSQPGIGQILGARVLAEFGDDPHRYADTKARRNYSGMSPITKPPAKAGSYWPATPGTGDFPTRSTNRRSPR